MKRKKKKYGKLSHCIFSIFLYVKSLLNSLFIVSLKNTFHLDFRNVLEISPLNFKRIVIVNFLQTFFFTFK